MKWLPRSLIHRRMDHNGGSLKRGVVDYLLGLAFVLLAA